MGNFEYKNNRAETYKKLKEAFKSEPDHEKRQAILDQEKSKPEFKEDEKLHKQELIEVEKRGGGDLRRDRDFKNSYIESFAGFYINKIINPKHKEYFPHFKEDRFEQSLDFLREHLKGSVLVDLGCGDSSSVSDSAYSLATVFDVKKYIGVERYSEQELPSYTKAINYLNKDSRFKKIIEQGHKAPQHEILLKTDMLSFLEKRTTQSNFMMHGIDSVILQVDSSKDNNYINRLQEEIARLVPKKGIVFGHNSIFLYKLEKLGFIRRKDLELTQDDQIWEKI